MVGLCRMATVKLYIKIMADFMSLLSAPKKTITFPSLSENEMNSEQEQVQEVE
jgi:hypothetical protein